MKRLAGVRWTELCIICQEALEITASEPRDGLERPLARAA